MIMSRTISSFSSTKKSMVEMNSLEILSARLRVFYYVRNIKDIFEFEGASDLF